jgi:transcriptional regulator with GAF, ATPase, and Fis domain
MSDEQVPTYAEAMEGALRERLLAETFVLVADTLVAGYDVVDLLQTLVERCAEILGAADAGIILADTVGNLEVVASTSESTRLIELMQLRGSGGPCIEAFLTGRPVTIADIAEVEGVWPEFACDARAAGYTAVHSTPMRLRTETIGALNLFRTTSGPLNADDVAATQALADVATIGILQERAFHEADIARQQLQRALDSRVVIEQAKGVIAQIHGLDMDLAFQLLRGHARSTGGRLHEVAQDVVERRLQL